MNNPARPYRLEACVTTFQQALHAQSAGADRIEICTQLDTGGLTPDFKLVAELSQILKIPVRVMIRNTPDGFEADELVMGEMIQSIGRFKALPVDGFVLGLLKNNKVDREAIQLILGHTHPFPVTFHKAIDLSDSMEADIAWMNTMTGIDTILTSGGAVNASDGMELILLMKSISDKTIMAGGRILPMDLDTLNKKLGLDWYHGSRIVGDTGNKN